MAGVNVNRNCTVSITSTVSAALKVMLNLNVKDLKTRTEPIWRILIYDRRGQDIIAPILNSKELRDIGVVLHVSLHIERDSIPDAAAIYFVEPNNENVDRICQDISRNLYDHYFLNFISNVSSQKIEQIALACVQSETPSIVKKVMDQYLDFIGLEDDMFILRELDKETVSYLGKNIFSNQLYIFHCSYYSIAAINRADAQDDEIEEVMNRICDGLFALLATLEFVPIIRCPKGNAAEMVAEKLNQKLRLTLQATKSTLFKGTSFTDLNDQRPLTFRRPLLIILDRNMDMATPLHHTWTYQALIHDVLSLKLNVVSIDEKDARGRTKFTKFDMAREDEFWQRHKGTPFPQVAQSVQEALETYKIEEENVKQLKSTMDMDVGGSLVGDNTAKIGAAISSLPELFKKKTLIDMHTTIATAVLDQIKERKLDSYFEAEEKILSKSLDKSPLELIKDTTAGTTKDKLRLCLINYLCASMTEDEVNQFERALEEAGCDLDAFKYIKRWKAIAKMPSPASRQYGGTNTVNMFSKLMTQGSQFVMEGVKNLVLKKHFLPITRVVDALMEMKNLPEVDDYQYFDPKLSDTSIKPPENRAAFQDVITITGLISFFYLTYTFSISQAIVFVVGGGNYIEYQNLVEYCLVSNLLTNYSKQLCFIQKTFI